jgi:YHS domain-containing protein
MNRKNLATLSLVAAISVGGMALAQMMPPGMKMGMGMMDLSPSTKPSTRPFQAVDVANTVCPVSGDKVATSKLVEVYDGKVYHLCCADCPADFEKDPAKFVKAIAADPAKYGIK